MMTTTEEAREGTSLAVPQDPGSSAESRACARESLALPSALPSTSVTERVRQAGEVAAKAVVLLDKPGTLLHSQPPTFRQAHGRHRECADWFKAPVLRWIRMAWGRFQVTCIKPPLNFAEWITLSPVWLASAAGGGAESVPAWPGSLADWQPLTFRQEVDLIHEVAGRFRPQWLGWPVYAFGYLHLVTVKPALNLLEWVTESPLRLLVAAALTAAIWLFS